MSPRYSVSATWEAEEAGAVALAVASLPATFGPAAPETAGLATPADVAVIDGAAGWSAHAAGAVEAGASAVMVVNPVPEATRQLAAAADAVGAVVVLDLRWASSPALVSSSGEPDARDAMRSGLGMASMLDSVATAAQGSDPRRLLGEHLAALLAVSGPLNDVLLLRSDASGYTGSGRLGNGAPFTVQGVLTDARAAGVDIRLYTSDGGVSIRVPEPHAAWPAEVRVTGKHGELLLPTIYESAHRAAWRRLREHLSTGTRPDDLAGFARLTDLYATISDT